MKLNPSVVPPGGQYEFPIGDAMIKAVALELLYDNVMMYKVQNPQHGPSDRESIIRDVDLYYCERWPSFCQPDVGEFAPQTTTGAKGINTALMARVADWTEFWMERKVNSPGRFLNKVNTEVAERRASKCINCPANRGGVSNCPRCDEQLSMQALAAVDNAATSVTRDLGYCECYGHDNKAAVWLNGSDLRVGDLDKDSIPDHCWKKTL